MHYILGSLFDDGSLTSRKGLYMNDDTESGEFEKQDDKEECSNFLDSSTNNADPNTKKKHESLKPHLQREPRRCNFGIEEPKGVHLGRVIDADVDERWLQWHQERMRQHLVHWIIRLYSISIFLGLAIGIILFAITKNPWYLVCPPVVSTVGGALLRIIFNYYFNHPKK